MACVYEEDKMKAKIVLLVFIFIGAVTIQITETKAEVISSDKVFEALGFITDYEPASFLDLLNEYGKTLETDETKQEISTVLDEPTDLTVAVSGKSLDLREPINPSLIDLLARIIEAEAKGESYEGKVAVGQVVLNRVNHHHFPDSVKEVIYQPRQFEPVMNGTIYNEATEISLKAAEEALKGKGPVEGALYFYNPAIAASQEWFETLDYVATIGNHVFRR